MISSRQEALGGIKNVLQPFYHRKHITHDQFKELSKVALSKVVLPATAVDVDVVALTELLVVARSDRDVCSQVQLLLDGLRQKTTASDALQCAAAPVANRFSLEGLRKHMARAAQSSSENVHKKHRVE